jgi:hypothetical protein
VLRELSVCAVAARADAIFRRGAISPVRRLTNSVENSSIAASVRDPTMHAPFAALVQSNAREKQRNADLREST